MIVAEEAENPSEHIKYREELTPVYRVGSDENSIMRGELSGGKG